VTAGANLDPVVEPGGLADVGASKAARRGGASAVDRVLRLAPIVVPYLMLATLIVVYGSVGEGVFTREELNIQAAAVLTLLLVAAGQTIVLLLGGIDLSVGGVLSLSTAVAATRLGAGGVGMVGWAVAILLIGVGAGALNGVLVARLRLQPFIVTLATWSVWGGTALWILPTEGGNIPASFIDWANATPLGIATPVYLILALAIFWLWFKRTRAGISIRAVGSSENSSFLSGVPTNRTVVTAYALSGLFAALGGLFLITQTASGSPTVGNDYILNSVAAVVIGGTSLFGGRGGLGGTIAGAIILTLIASVIFTLNISSFWTPILTGVLLILAVLVNSVTELYARRRGIA
jgi:ribose transport system permease protein